MSSVRIQNGQTERIEAVMLDAMGVALTGLSDVFLFVRRISDDKFLDFDDNTFKSSGWTDIDQVMTEVDAMNAAGTYGYDFDTAGFDDNTYEIRVTSATGVNVPQVGELKVGDVMDDIVLSRKMLRNKLTIDKANGKLQLWNNAGTNVDYEWPLTDKDSLSPVLTGTDPYNRGQPVAL